MVLTINGDRQHVASTTLEALLDELAYEERFFAVALNGAVVRRAAWSQTELRDGDSLEILTPRQGG